jgi:hypothetical protein
VNRSVPTLLGIVIILLVVVLVVVVFNYRLYSGLGRGEKVVGTSSHEILTGEEPITEEIGISEVLTAGEPEKTVTGNLEPGPSKRMETDMETRDQRAKPQSVRGTRGTEVAPEETSETQRRRR